MMDVLSQAMTWIEIHPGVTGWAFGVSLAIALASLLVIPALVARMPADYFIRPPHRGDREGHWIVRTVVRALKNTVGAALVLMGLVMIFTPGQGVLAVLIGISLLEFPGKRRLELRIICTAPVAHSVAWIRNRAGSPPLELPRN